jgi:acyl-CoA synthetase (NDP forming)
MPFRSVGKAVKAITRWVWYGRWRAHADRVPAPKPLLFAADTGNPLPDLSTEPLAKQWLSSHDIPVPAHRLARTLEEAVAAAGEPGWPVVAKIVSPDVAHKSDAGGVAIGVRDAREMDEVWTRIHASVRAAMPQARIEGLLIEAMAPAGGIETLVGVHRDPCFGHVISVGLGGIHVEVLQDVSRRLLPITLDDARAMLGELRAHAILRGIRGRPARDVEALARTLVAVSGLVSAYHDSIAELEINPLWVGAEGEGVLALDALVIRAGAAT